MPWIDTVRGVLDLYEISQPAPFAFLKLILLISLLSNRLGTFHVLILLLFGLTATLLIIRHMQFYGESGWFQTTARWALAPVIVATVYFTVSLMDRSKVLSTCSAAATSLLAAVGFNVGFGVLGFGHFMYGSNQSGTSGFIAAGNDISLMLVIGAALRMLVMLELKSSRARRAALIIYVLSCGMFMGTKTALFGYLAIFLVAQACSIAAHLRSGYLSRELLRNSATITILAPLILIGGAVWLASAEGLSTRWTFAFESGWVGWLLSGRDIVLSAALPQWFSLISFDALFFGIGFEAYASLASGRTAEMDLFDFAIAMGLLGVIIAYALPVFLASTALFVCNRFSFTTNFYAASLLVLFSLSLISGHVYSSFICAPFIGLVFSFSKVTFGSTPGAPRKVTAYLQRD